MNPLSLLFGVGSVGPFASRVFLPALVTALLVRFGVHIPLLQHLLILQHVHHQPAWFTSDAAIIVLAVLAGLEIFGQKNPEIRNFFHEIDIYLKPALALLTSLGVMQATDSAFLQQVAVKHANLLDGLVPLGVAVATFKVASLRKGVAKLTYDHLDGTHADHLLNWAEDAWAGAGAVIVVLFPVLACLLVAAGVGALALVKRRVDVREENAKLACPSCSTLNYASAITCVSCRQPLPGPRAVGFLGQSRLDVAAELDTHPFRLMEKRRCPVCATKLPPRKPLEPCPACGDSTRVTPAFTGAYIAYITRRLPMVLAVCFALSLVPIVGLIFGLVYARATLVLPFSQYLPAGRQFLLRWGIRILFLVLMVVQVIPLLGGFVVPVMAFISFGAYRETYRRVLNRNEDWGRNIAPAAM